MKKIFLLLHIIYRLSYNSNLKKNFNLLFEFNIKIDKK